MTQATPVTVYVSPGDPSCTALLKYLDDRGVEYRVSDITTDPSASATLLGRLGRVTVPVTQVGDKLLTGFDPLQLARFLPRTENDEPHVTFGAAVRTVTADIASAAGLPAPYGVEVGPVKVGSAAAAAAIEPGDVITEIGGYTLTAGREQFVQAVSSRRPGDTMSLTIWRDGRSLQVPVTFPVVAERPATPNA